MVTTVEMQFFERPTDNEIHFMRLAAQKLTKDPLTVEISKSDDLLNIATAIFRLKNEAQYKVVDHSLDQLRSGRAWSHGTPRERAPEVHWPQLEHHLFGIDENSKRGQACACH